MERKQPAYSEAPAASIDCDHLASTRFIEADARKYPFRDPLGRINLHLVNISLAEAEMDGAARETCERLRAWQRHAVRALNARPKQEKLTLDQLSHQDSSDDEDDPKPKTTKSEPPQTVTMRRRLFRAPQKEDEPIFIDTDTDSDSLDADRLYRCRLADEGADKKSAQRKSMHASRGGRGAADDELSEEVSSSSGTTDDDVYEVEAVLEEDEYGGKGFLIRWAGFGSEHDSWEPEWNVAPHLVAEFRKERGLARRHTGDDYMLGRTKMLWCATCATHLASDGFSAQQRRNDPPKRSCLVHHYRTEAPHYAVSSVTGTRVSTHVMTTPARSPASLKRSRPAIERSPASVPPPPAKAHRPVARALSHRAAALEMRTSRLFGFGSL